MSNFERNLTLEADMKKAWKRDEFEVYLQPQMRADDWKITGFEALIRWRHPTRGILMPQQFMDTARDLELIEQLDYMVFEKVCAFLHKRYEEGKTLFCISCNFDREHFQKSDFVGIVQKIRNRYHIPTKYLAIEMLEGSTFARERLVQKNVQELNELGYQVYLDDCGAINSNIGDLMFHSITHLKIDKNMIDNIERENVQILLQGLCSIAHRLIYTVVCEGVETPRQFELVKKCGVDVVQGFYFYEPMDISHAEILYDALA